MAQPKSGSKTQGFVDKMSSHLNEDDRVKQTPLAKLNVFSSEMYDIDFYVYPRLAGNPAFEKLELICALVTYKEERLRIMVKMGAIDSKGKPEETIRNFLEHQEPRGQSPLMLVRRAKTWCGIPLTKSDMLTLTAAGINVDAHE